MSTDAHLWAIVYDDTVRAEKLRDAIVELGWGSGKADKYLVLLDIAIIVRHSDGNFTLDRKPFSVVTNILGSTVVGFLSGLAVAAPLTGATIGALVGGANNALAARACISEDFIREVKNLMKPGTSAVFVLDNDGDLGVILPSIQGLGGTVVKTNVDVDRAKLIQSRLAAESQILEN
jgi:uncharacterized membrane protein